MSPALLTVQRQHGVHAQWRMADCGQLYQQHWAWEYLRAAQDSELHVKGCTLFI